MNVNIDLVTVTCDECGDFLKLEVDVSIYAIRQLSALIKAAGWNASANCGTVLCPNCGPDWSDDE